MPPSHHALVARALRLVWVGVILFGDLWVFVSSLLECKWPATADADDKSKEGGTHVLLIADTQVQHHALLPKDRRWFHPVLFEELNLRKSWRVASYLRPDAVVFLGDMLSNGKVAKNQQQYESAVDKFKSIFHIADPRTKAYYVPGNNDIGLGLDRSTSRVLRSFYRDSFGHANHQFIIQNHTFVAVDSAGLVDEDYLRNGEHVSFSAWTPLPGGTVSFVEQVAQQKPAEPVILLTHIPLARAESAQCGPLREHGTIRRGAGPGWQSTLTKQSTSFLLDTLRPSIVFSADNRDYCDYTHTVVRPDSAASEGIHRVREITLKSFSTSTHIRRPGFQLLTLVDPAAVQNDTTSRVPSSLAERVCFLPDQSRIYTYLYAPLLVLSLVVLARFHFTKMKRKPLALALKPSLASGISDDEDRSPSSLTGHSTSTFPGAEPMWSPFMPFTPATPVVPTPKMRQPSVTSVDRMYRQSSVSSLSSTTTLLGGENALEGSFELGEQELMYDFPDCKGSTTTTMSKLWEKRSSSFDSRQFFTGDLEAFQDDEEAVPPFVESDSVMAHGDRPRRTRWTTSYSFVFRGRRRRIRLCLPSRSALWNLMEFIGVVDESRSRTGLLARRSGQSGYLGDVVGVFWPAAAVWLVVNGLFML